MGEKYSRTLPPLQKGYGECNKVTYINYIIYIKIQAHGPPTPLTARLRRVQQGYGACTKVTRLGAEGSVAVQQGYALRQGRGGGGVAVQQGYGPCIKVTHSTFSDSEGTKFFAFYVLCPAAIVISL